MRSAAIFFAAVLLALGSVGAIPTDPSACRRGGKLYFSQGIYDKAITQLECAVQGKPDDYEGWLWLGRSYGEVGRFQDAARAFAEAEKKDKQKEEVANAREHYWVTQYNTGMAVLKKAEDAVKGGASDTTATVQADYREALKDFDNSIALDPGKRRAYTFRGYVLNKLGQPDESLASFEKGVSIPLDPKDKLDQDALDIARKNLLVAYKDLGNKLMAEETPEALNKALDAYQKAAAMDSSDVGVLFRMATVHYQIARTDSTRSAAEYPIAARMYEQVNSMLAAANGGKNDEDTLYNLTLVYIEMSDFASAEKTARMLVDANPKSPDGHLLLGRVYARKGDNKSAFGELLVGGALQKGEPGPTTQADIEKSFSERFGPGNDAASVLGEMGPPQETRTHEDQGQTVDGWFYWDRGKALAFSNGKKLVEITFAPVTGS